MKVLYTNESNLEKMLAAENFIACENEFVLYNIPIAASGEILYRDDVTMSDDFKVFEVSGNPENSKIDYDTLLKTLN